MARISTQRARCREHRPHRRRTVIRDRRTVMTRRLLVMAVVLSGAACEHAELPEAAGFGPRPTLPAPNKSLIPTIKVANAKGWPAGATPHSAPGTRVNAFATGLDHPRSLYVLPNGDVLVAETN